MVLFKALLDKVMRGWNRTGSTTLNDIRSLCPKFLRKIVFNMNTLKGYVIYKYGNFGPIFLRDELSFFYGKGNNNKVEP